MSRYLDYSKEDELRKKIFTKSNINDIKFPLEMYVEAFEDVEQPENDYVRVKVDLDTMNRILKSISKDYFTNTCSFELEKKSVPFVLKLVIIDDQTKEPVKDLVSITFGLDHCTLISKETGAKFKFKYYLHTHDFWKDLVEQAVVIA